MGRIEIAVRPRSPLALPRMLGGDRVTRRNGPWRERLLALDGGAMILRIRPDREARPPRPGRGTGRPEPAGRRFVLSAEPVEPGRLSGPGADRLDLPGEPELAAGLGRLRHAYGLDDDLTGFRDRFRDDPVLGPPIRRRLAQRPPRRPLAWEALLWAITEQLIEYRRAAAIQRRMVRRWGIRLDRGEGDALAAVPSPQAVAALAPAELQACDLGARRAVAMVRAAREVAAGRIDPEDPADDARLTAIPEIGPWTVACLALRGRGEPDALLAGDLAQVKLVGHRAGLGRLAAIEEVEAFYAPYAPYRGIAGELLAAESAAVINGPGNRARIARGLPRAA